MEPLRVKGILIEFLRYGLRRLAGALAIKKQSNANIKVTQILLIRIT